ncbi:MAG: thiol reductase thioredoxin [Chloroflexi bacterium]|jgi:thioredoxin 1|nr:MAG: thiol reductase thioredoxin [Chloroflexota bacterium]TMC19774.1 MAG: thiol reductase thioredoxin [Chloroflexota bacterium]TMC83946.1 MAG: thiol reductase thioredoxin [Chloroflexota bacterium]
MTDTYIDVSDQDFAEKILQAEQMVLVNFSAENSGACQIQDPEFEAISKEFQGRVMFARINTDKNDKATSQWKIEGIPTIIFFKGGREINRIKGIIMRERLRRQIEGALLAN